MIVIISHPTPVEGEFRILHQLFDAGLEFFHLYKPGFSRKEIEAYWVKIPEKYRKKVSLHSDHLKFHSLQELEECSVDYEYAFLSPIFDSISKTGYKSPFDLKELREVLKGRNEKIIAIGGIDEDKIEKVKEAGFSGIALLGAMWKNEDPVKKYKKIKERWLK
jgi:thiamine-phosphate pyrophosphorylase